MKLTKIEIEELWEKAEAESQAEARAWVAAVLKAWSERTPPVAPHGDARCNDPKCACQEG